MEAKQATRRVLDKEQILQVFSKYLVRKHGGTTDEYLNDHSILDDLVKNDKTFPWQEIATEVNLDRWRLYHWYFETFQRMLAGSIDKEDVEKMRDMIKTAMDKEDPLDKEFQQFVKTSLSKEYHRSSFSIAFNNTKREVMKELGKTELPVARPLRFDNNSEVEQMLEQQEYRLMKEEEQRTSQMMRNETLAKATLPEQSEQVVEQVQPVEEIQAQTKQESMKDPISEVDFIDEISVIPGEMDNPDHFMTSLMNEDTDYLDLDDCQPLFADIYAKVTLPVQYDLNEESCLSMSNYEPQSSCMSSFVSVIKQESDEKKIM